MADAYYLLVDKLKDYLQISYRLVLIWLYDLKHSSYVVGYYL